jgi:CubicO group peptidase (beta-lactamase class C family)
MKLQRSAPEKQGVKSQAIVEFLSKIKEENHELHSFMLLKNGEVISECWWEPYAPQYRHQLFSLSKSFTSTAIGMAVNEGLLTVDTLLADIFKEEIAELGNDVDEKIKKMTVKHILMMGTGMEYEKWDFWNTQTNNVKNFLSSHIKNEPGSVFFYHTLATYMQSAVITKLTGEKLVDYLKPRLFDPLGIDPFWEEDYRGISYGGFGLNLKTEEIAKFGQLYLQKGNWNGKQLVSESWIAEATSKQIDNAAPSEHEQGDWNQGYGYQFWMCKPEGVYRGDGMFGQFCIVMPDADSVIAITSNADMQRVQDLIWDILLPALRENNKSGENKENKTEHSKLLKAQKNLSHLKTNENAANFSEMRGEYQSGELNVYVDFNASDGVIAMTKDNKEYIYRFEKNAWAENAIVLAGNTAKFMRSKTYAEWNAREGELILTLWFYETPVKNKIKLTFNKNKTKLNFAVINPDSLVGGNDFSVDLEFVKGSDLCVPK